MTDGEFCLQLLLLNRAKNAYRGLRERQLKCEKHQYTHFIGLVLLHWLEKSVFEKLFPVVEKRKMKQNVQEAKTTTWTAGKYKRSHFRIRFKSLVNKWLTALLISYSDKVKVLQWLYVSCMCVSKQIYSFEITRQHKSINININKFSLYVSVFCWLFLDWYCIIKNKTVVVRKLIQIFAGFLNENVNWLRSLD